MFIIHDALSQIMQEEYGDTALLAASGEGHIKCATVLLKHGAAVDYVSTVRLLYVNDGHCVAQNGVLSLE